MTNLDAMWKALESHQPIADKKGYGRAWERMCVERTEDAFFRVLRMEKEARKHSGARSELVTDTVFKTIAAVALAADAADMAGTAISYITRANEEAAK